MANKRINDLQARSSADDTCNIAADDASQTWRVTLAQVKTYIRAAIAPLATLGDVIYGGASGATTILAGNTTTTKKFLAQTGNGTVSAAPAWTQPAFTDLSGWVAPTVQKFTSGSGNYTTPANVRYIRVRAVGGGGGAAGATANAGTAGGSTTFGSTLIVCGGGGGALYNDVAGAGGTASLGTGPIGTAIPGAAGNGGSYTGGTSGGYFNGACGGSSFFGGAGGGATYGGAAGGNAVANSGSGGGGASGGVNTRGASSGGAGGFVDALIVPTAAQVFPYAVGAGGAGGAAGGFKGGDGAAGYIEVTEFYQ